MLLQAILTLHRLEQNGDELWPLPGAVQTGHLGYQYCDLGCYLLKKKKKNMQERKVDQGQSINTAQGGANLMGILLRGSLLKISSLNKYDTEYQTSTINTVYIVHPSGDR